MWYEYHMEARLIYHEKFVFNDGSIREMVIWRLPRKTPERPHGLKYRLHYGPPGGQCIVRYDNETGKGDHKHVGNREEPYTFKTVEQLVDDFLQDVDRFRRRI